MPMKYSTQRGFTLIEALVAMVVIAIGLLGIAGLQALSLNNTVIARNRTVAAIDADGLASMMHANTVYWQSAAVPSGVNGFSITGAVIGDNTLNGQTQDCTVAACTAIQMAGYDLKQWGVSVANSLPSGTGNLQCSVFNGLAVSCVISVSWSETNLALNAITGAETGSLASGSSTTQTYTLVMQP